MSRFFVRLSLFAALLSPLCVLAACHSRHIEINVDNRTGDAIKLLEVDYPSASFGADSIAPGSSFRYRIQVQGRGPVGVTYTPAGGAQIHLEGAELAQGQEGSLSIILLPGGKAEFQPNWPLRLKIQHSVN